MLLHCSKLYYIADMHSTALRTYLPSGKRLHVVEVNVQWWRCSHALYKLAPNIMTKPSTKASRGREQHHVNGYTLGCLQGQAKWRTGAPIRLPLEFFSFAKRLFYEKPHIKNQAIAALRRSVGLLGRFVTVWKNWTGHPPCDACAPRVNNVWCCTCCLYTQFFINLVPEHYIYIYMYNICYLKWARSALRDLWLEVWGSSCW